MASFRNTHKQAAHVVRQALALGTARHTQRGSGQIHSVGTARAYQQSLTQVAHWLRATGHLAGLHRLTPALAAAYLQERAESVQQRTLDLDRQALHTVPGIDRLPRVHSALAPSALATEGRAYTPVQVQAIAAAQTARHGLATQLAAATGLRAHELFTLRPAAEQPASTHRTWAPTRFLGREDTVRYTVVGKGGLVREVAVPTSLATHLEARRLPAPVGVTDRRVQYQTRYDLGGGHAWSQSFSAASQRVLGWSTGAHGLRHHYAQDRLEAFQQRGWSYQDALGLVSQELGHFRATITEVYLR